MHLLRWIGIALAVIVFALVGAVIAARVSDGPFEPYPFALLQAGPLRAGELVAGAEPDWSFARDIELMEFQLLEPPRSRHTWLVVHQGRLYVPSGYMNSWWGNLWKRWPFAAMKDGRAVVRIDGKRYEREAIRVTNPEIFWPLAREVTRKYQLEQEIPDELPPIEATGVWFFELAPRASAER